MGEETEEPLQTSGIIYFWDRGFVEDVEVDGAPIFKVVNVESKLSYN